MSENCNNCKYFPKYNLGKISEKCGFSVEEFLVLVNDGMWCGNYKKIDKKFEKQIIEAERKLNEIRFMKQSRSEAIPIEWIRNWSYRANREYHIALMLYDWEKENENN